MKKSSKHSYNTYMHTNFFDHVDIPKENIHIPDGEVDQKDLLDYCYQYEQQISKAGEIDVQILGIGRSGHIGFNEPGSSGNSLTRLITLDKKTREDAADEFMGIDNVPLYAITMGIQTILRAHKVILMAFSEGKAEIVAKACESSPNSSCPSTFLQLSSDALFVLDYPAAQKLTRYNAPWLIKECRQDPNFKFDEYWTKKAVVWLCQKVNKPILRLTQEDYCKNSLELLLKQQGDGNCGIVNLKVFDSIKKIITGWPAGGKPDNQQYDSYYVNKSISPKQVLIFSPHPDDDVICMGGTMLKLTNQGHKVHVAYETSGNFAVYNHESIKYNDFIKEFAKTYLQGDAQKQIVEQSKKIFQQHQNPIDGKHDQPEVRTIKTLIRRVEARAAAQSLGILYDNIFHLDLPFYESGQLKKKPLSQDDIQIVKDLIIKIKPEILFAAGDLTDPHGTHRVCLQAVLGAIQQLEKEQPDLLKSTKFYLYRGAWQEWEIENICLIVPMSPDELLAKRYSVFKHASQCNQAMFPGNDKREFWQRSEDRNRSTALLLKDLGMVQYLSLIHI
eukprot:TRINITY_DN3595_c0_g3_i3.p1 TRINITY_DN3595_c0_g3~~TRINITY_DN3595_c0_g3_i3.p1  ORF type:complete len:559 (-),score=102.52 TRINITY_DN3595_c0_g3_i3:73-1749(-)